MESRYAETEPNSLTRIEECVRKATATWGSAHAELACNYDHLHALIDAMKSLAEGILGCTAPVFDETLTQIRPEPLRKGLPHRNLTLGRATESM